MISRKVYGIWQITFFHCLLEIVHLKISSVGSNSFSSLSPGSRWDYSKISVIWIAPVVAKCSNGSIRSVPSSTNLTFFNFSNSYILEDSGRANINSSNFFVPLGSLWRLRTSYGSRFPKKSKKFYSNSNIITERRTT